MKETVLTECQPFADEVARLVPKALGARIVSPDSAPLQMIVEVDIDTEYGKLQVRGLISEQLLIDNEAKIVKLMAGLIAAAAERAISERKQNAKA